MTDTQDLFSRALSLDRQCRAWERYNATKQATRQKALPAWNMSGLENLLLETQAAWTAYDKAQLEETGNRRQLIGSW